MNNTSINIIILIALTLLWSHQSNGQISHFFDILLSNGTIPDTNQFFKEYDFVIIGSGSGGSVMANRLSEIEDWNVLLLEVGKEENFISDIPLTAGLTQITNYNWGYKADPMKGACLGLKGGVCNWPRGRALGGTSVINFNVFTRGNKRDYDEWAELGNHGWSYDEVLPYFKKSENMKIEDLKNSPYHGINGPVDIETAGYISPLGDSFIEAGKNLGYEHNDPSGPKQLGFSLVQATLRNGRRCSAAKAYLNNIVRRKNLHISVNSWVTKILIDPQTRRAYAVEFVKWKKRFVVYAKKEVILSAGTIGSPQLLMLSGVGPKAHLKEMGITVIQNLKVGYNLMDHVSLPGITFPVNQPVTIIEDNLQRPIPIIQYLLGNKGPFTIPGGAEGVAFIKTNLSFLAPDIPDIELVMGVGALSGDTSGTLRDLLGIPTEFVMKTFGSILKQHAFAIAPVLMRPKSRGRIYLKSTNPFHWPRMQGNYYGNYDDLLVMREGVKMAVQIGESESFRKFNAKLHSTPFYGCEMHKFRSDDYWDCCIRKIGSSLQHQSGTCKMGPPSDRTAVVNPELLVYGLKNLRVVDASIIPVIPASHTNPVVYMIAEKAADMVKDKWKNEIR